MSELNLIIAQINPIVGDIDGNTAQITSICKAHANDANALLVFPELALTGYPPEDLLTRPGFVDTTMQALDAIIAKSKDWQCSLLLGTPWKKDDLLFNAALLISSGEVKHVHTKNCLPNYSVFDERRYFAQGSAPIMVEHLSTKIGILICEDGWHEHNIKLLARQGTQLVLTISASPFAVGKKQKRTDYFSKMAKHHGVKIVYANLVGGQDDLVFDGASFIVNHDGAIVRQLPAFEESCHPTASGSERAGPQNEAQDYARSPRDQQDNAITPYPDNVEAMYQAVTLGLRSYLHKNGLEKIVLGLSGGIDSALVAAIAVDALGAGNVRGALLPSEFTSDDSNVDALALAKNLGIETSNVPIMGFVDAAEDSLITNLKTQGVDISQWRSNLAIGGNLQARFRGDVLMAISNATGAALLNTSNKSEIAVGYSTLYGDSCGAYSPLKDVYKTEVYALANWRNRDGEVIPASTINKAPTAELKPEQKDSDQLPDYDVLDKILHGLIEEKLSVDELTKLGFEADIVQRIYDMIRMSEYKRRQAPPGPRVSQMLFGKEWRMPLTNGYKG